MVVPIGIDPLNGVVAAYSTVTGDLATLKIEKITPNDIEKIDEQLLSIKEHFPAIYVNVCVCLDGKYGSDIRMEFIENAKKHNFTNFSILDFTSALYIHAVFKSAFKSNMEDNIWIFWLGNCYVYQNIDENIVFLKSYPFLNKNNFISQLPKPAAIFYPFNTTQKLLNDLFSDVKVYYFSSFLPETAALIKAQFMGENNIKMSSLKIKPCCGRKIEVFVNEQICLTVTPEQSLPFKNEINVKAAEKMVKLKILEDDSEVRELLLEFKIFLFTIDLNGVCDIEKIDDTELFNTVTSKHLSDDTKLKPETPKKMALEDISPEVIPSPNIKLAAKNYIIPKKFEPFVKIIRQLGNIQAELNILHPLIIFTETEFNLSKFDYFKNCNKSYKEAIENLETLLENVKIQVYAEKDKFSGDYLKDLTDSIVTQHIKLKQNYDKNQILMENAETYLASFNQEMEWIESKLINDDLKFDNYENSLKALKMFKILKQEVKDREENYQKVVSNGKEFITKANKNETVEFINELEDNWNRLQEYIKFNSTIVAKVQKAGECCTRAYAIEEWISVKSKMITRNDSFTGSDIIKEMLMKKTKKLLEDVESYNETIQSFENDTNAIKSEIVLSGNATKTKLSVFFDALQTRMKNIKISYDELKENVKDQIKKMDEEKIAFEFIKKCNSMEQRIKQIFQSVAIEITTENMKMMKKRIVEVEDSIKNYEEREIMSLTEIAEKLIAAGFLEAKLKIKNISNLIEERDKILEQKRAEMEGFLEVEIFLSNCDIVIQRIQIEMEKVINSTAAKIEIDEYKKEQKRFYDNFIQLSNSYDNFKNLNEKSQKEINKKMEEIQEVYNDFTKLIETNSETSVKTNEITEFYDTAKEILKCLLNLISEVKWIDGVNVFETSNALLQQHLELKQEFPSIQEIESIKLFGQQLINQNPDLEDVNDKLNAITKVKEAFDEQWQKRYEDLQNIEKFNSLTDACIKLFQKYLEFLQNNEEQNIDDNRKSNMMTQIDLHINIIQETGQKVKEIREDFAEYIDKKNNEILKLQQELIEKLCKQEYKNKLPSDTPIKHVVTNEYLIPKKLTNYDKKINAVGIDLGTSRCCMAVNRNNKMETVALENTGERPLPSFIAFDEVDDKCGDIVIQGLQRGKDKFTCFDIKRIIGKNFHDIIPDKSWPFTVIEEDENVLIKTKNIDGEVKKKPEEISAVLLKYMKEKASIFQGKKLTEAVLTVPAAFTEKQKEATLKAAIIAGWETIHLLPEPVAASFAYFNNRQIPNGSNVLLFDLGGGTLDVCLFKIVDGSLQIISNNGDTCLGGRDIDNLLIRHFTTILKYKHEINISERVKRIYQLMLECQKIKHNLTIREDDILDVETFDSNIEGTIKIERRELEDLVMDLIQRMRAAINQTLTNAGMCHKEISSVLQVGGGCRMPIVKDMLKKMFPNAEQCCEEQPDEVVAVGAAIYAYHLATKDSCET